jgi:hypothetical protein
LHSRSTLCAASVDIRWSLIPQGIQCKTACNLQAVVIYRSGNPPHKTSEIPSKESISLSGWKVYGSGHNVCDAYSGAPDHQFR